MSVLDDLPRRTRLLAALGLSTTVLGGAALGFGSVVRARVTSVAERRGLQLDVGTVRPGLGAIWLKDVDVRAEKLPGVSAHVTALRVKLGWGLGVSALELHGADVALKGEADELARQWKAFRAERGEATEPEVAGPRIAADGIHVGWQVRLGEPAQHAWGLRYEREHDTERVGADLVRLHDVTLDVEARGPRATLRRAGATPNTVGATSRQLESLRAQGLEVSVTASEPKAPPPNKDPKKTGFKGDPQRGPRLRALLGEVAAGISRSLPDGAGLDLEGVALHYHSGEDALHFGPSTLRVLRFGALVDWSLAPKPEASGTPLELKLSLPIAAGEVKAQLRGGPVSLRSLGVREGDFGLLGVELATLQATADVTLAGDGSVLTFSGNGVLDNVSMKRKELSPIPLSGIHAAFRARGSASLDGAKLELDDGELSLGEVRVQGAGKLSRSEKGTQLHWRGGVPLAACQAFLDATPRGLTPLLGSLRMTGTFAVSTALDFDSERPTDTKVRLNVANDCQIQQISPELSPKRFSTYWRREVKGPNKQSIEVESGPGSPDWVPYDAISPYMEAAVLVCEDGHFPYHRGFDFEAMQNSIRDNLNQGRFARGASTISMQLAKNLYLGKEKTLGRKLQEAVLTQLLEQELSKQQLMELYLNVIEYGPGIYGIGPAAQYYFKKRPSELTLAQSLYIASILPNPEKQHFDQDGKVSAGWTRYLQKLMHIAKKIGRIDGEQLAVGLTEQVVFRSADTGATMPPSTYPGDDADTPSELSP